MQKFNWLQELQAIPEWREVQVRNNYLDIRSLVISTIERVDELYCTAITFCAVGNSPRQLSKISG